MHLKYCPIHSCSMTKKTVSGFAIDVCRKCEEALGKLPSAVEEVDWQQEACENITAALKSASESVGIFEIETAAKPTRYNRGTIEVWDAIEKLQLNYMQGNVLKYVSRYKDKKGPEDLLKAINYIVKMIAQETGEDYYELHKLTPEELAKRIKK